VLTEIDIQAKLKEKLGVEPASVWNIRIDRERDGGTLSRLPSISSGP
jgi:hypothetical protein